MAEPVRTRRAWSRVALLALAIVFAAATLAYNILWIIAVRWEPRVELGFSNTPSLEVTGVYPGGPAEKAGLRTGDRIQSIGSTSLAKVSLFKAYAAYKPGDSVQMTVARPGSPALLVLHGVFRRRLNYFQGGGLTQFLARQVRHVSTVPFFTVGLIILFLRFEDPMAWLLALLFGSYTATTGFPDDFSAIAPAAGPFIVAYEAFFFGLFTPLFYWFFALFPRRSPLDIRVPWLKWLALAVGLAVGLPGLRDGRLQFPPPLAKLIGAAASQNIIVAYVLVFLTLGLVSLATNYLRAGDPEARRKIRVIFWGNLLGLGPRLVEFAARTFLGFQTPEWLDVALIAIAFLIPLSFAYAVVKHRVLEIPVLLRRSARYLLVQRGFTILLSISSAGVMLLFALLFPRYLQAAAEVTQPSGIALGAIFGTALLWGGLRIHHEVSGRIDRAFFRSSYDARVILEDLAQEARAVTDRAALAQLLNRHIVEALHPSSLAVYLGDRDGRLTAAQGDVPPELHDIPANLAVVAEVARRGRPWELAPAAEESAELAPLHPQCVVPVLGHRGLLEGLLVLGPRLSEEPYSGEDKRLLASVAAQAGINLENIRLAEEIAAQLETERRAAREMEIAKEVQNRLLPQGPPSLKTLECAAQCIQARSVGGDYYDFLDLGPGRVGFVLADVSGKGVHAALLMANLQAHLHSQSGIAPLDPARMLERVNHMLWKSTAPQHYATLFFGSYDDSTRRLAYVNCGHNPPIWLRPDGTVERLAATATVIGLLEQWECTVGQVRLAAGDLLVIFSDGVSEAARGEEEFGEARLICELKAARNRPVNEIVTSVLTSVQQFSGGDQSDDLTLLIARVRP
jgi:phosphoserine phosphatase RsbU/P